MNKPVSVRQSPYSDIFADSRPCEALSIPVERCNPHVGEFEKFPRERKKTLEDSLLCRKHKCAEFAKAAAMGLPEKRCLVDHTDFSNVPRRCRVDDLFRIDADRSDVRRPCHRRCGKVACMSD